MTIYTAVCSLKGAQVAKIQDDGYSLYEYFTGYDFMGSANWSKDSNDAILMGLEEAEQIADDLTAGEEECRPVKRIAIGDGLEKAVTLDRDDNFVYTVRVWDKFNPERDEIDTFDSFTYACVRFFRACRAAGVEPRKL